MQVWDVMALEVEPHHPEVLTTTDEGRAIVVALRSGESLQEHEVHERTWLMVTRGRVQARDADGGSLEALPGTLLAFDPRERRELRAVEDSQLLMLLTPWPAPDRVA